MNFLILSDLHLEFGVPYVPPFDVAYDAVVLAGDITSKGHTISWAVSLFGTDVPIIVVPGNHEYYNGNLQSMRRQFQMDAGGYANVHVLDPGEVFLDGGRIRVLGCTIWTDFEMPVLTRDGPVAHREGAMEEAWRFLNDYRLIWFCPPSTRERPFEPLDSLELHRAERVWLLAKLNEPFDGATVVVTHHGPSSGSVAEQWAESWLTPAFSSQLPDEFFVAPALWIHGHTHSSRDYVRGNTRVVCNPRGYPSRKRGFENKEFDAGLVIDVRST
jgi:predicted phosphodiesterase